MLCAAIGGFHKLRENPTFSLLECNQSVLARKRHNNHIASLWYVLSPGTIRFQSQGISAFYRLKEQQTSVTTGHHIDLV